VHPSLLQPPSTQHSIADWTTPKRELYLQWAPSFRQGMRIGAVLVEKFVFDRDPSCCRCNTGVAGRSVGRLFYWVAVLIFVSPLWACKRQLNEAVERLHHLRPSSAELHICTALPIPRSSIGWEEVPSSFPLRHFPTFRRPRRHLGMIAEYGVKPEARQDDVGCENIFRYSSTAPAGKERAWSL
jgi:hypothetical protein